MFHRIARPANGPAVSGARARRPVQEVLEPSSIGHLELMNVSPPGRIFFDILRTSVQERSGHVSARTTSKATPVPRGLRSARSQRLDA
jgi:hypothetical protein